jgi:alkanesulfonate monooxygenase SsuD/methylene tetrahydromethanopterin reductase-like flavin-dependent oxidoreductase (luciferase family)
VSENTIRYTAANDIVPWILLSNPPDFRRLCETYRDVAAGNGRNLALGQSVGAFRAIHFGDTEQQAVDLLRDTNYHGFQAYFSGFGFWEAFRSQEDEAKYPTKPNYTMLPPEEWPVERMRKVRYALAGTPDQVLRQLDDLVTLQGGGGELEWLGWFFDQGFMSWDEERRQIELFAKHVIPRFKDIGDYETAPARAAG